MNPPHSSPEEIFRRLLDGSATLLGAPHDSGIAFPDDDLHRDILLPLLPALLGDSAIRKHWHEQAASGFPARLMRHLQSGDAAPRWEAGDFEIHVTASYSAGPDARALADTLLSEESLREMSAVLMNQVLDVVWPKIETPAAEVVAPTVEVAVPEPEPIVAVTLDTAVGLLPLPATVPKHRQQWRAVRGSRENPIAGAKTWRGKIGEPGWSAGNPIAGGAADW